MKNWLIKIRNDRKRFCKSRVHKLNKKVSWRLIVLILVPLFLFFGLWVTKGNQWFVYRFQILLAQLGFDSQMVLDNMIREAAFLGNSVWMMATILSGAVIFYCSLLSYKSYGIPNRTLIAYSVGSWSLPLIVASTIVMVLSMTGAYYTDCYTLFYFWAIYSLMPQVIAYIYCIRCCSRKQCFRIILKVEDKQYKWLHKEILAVTAECSREGDTTARQKNEVYENLTFHAQNVMGGEETSEEKMELIQQILFVPFRKHRYRCSDQPGDLQSIYLYIYQNVKRVVCYSDTGLSDLEADRFYFWIYENIKNIERIYHEKAGKINLKRAGDSGKNREIPYPLYWGKLAIYLSAVFHAVLPERNMRNRWQFVVHIVKDLLVSDEEKRLVIGMLLCSIEYLDHIGQIDIHSQGDDLFENDGENRDTNDFMDVKKCLDALNIKNNWSADDYILENMYYFLRIWFADTTGAGNFWKLFYLIKRSMEMKSTKAAIAYFL